MPAVVLADEIARLNLSETCASFLLLDSCGGDAKIAARIVREAEQLQPATLDLIFNRATNAIKGGQDCTPAQMAAVIVTSRRLVAMNHALTERPNMEVAN